MGCCYTAYLVILKERSHINIVLLHLDINPIVPIQKDKYSSSWKKTQLQSKSIVDQTSQVWKQSVAILRITNEGFSLNCVSARYRVDS